MGPRVGEVARRGAFLLEAPPQQPVPRPAVQRVVLDDRPHHALRFRDAACRCFDPGRTGPQRHRRLGLGVLLPARGPCFGRAAQLREQHRPQVACLHVGRLEPQDLLVAAEPLGRRVGSVRARGERERVRVARCELPQALGGHAIAGLLARSLEPRAADARAELGASPERLEQPRGVGRSAPLEQHVGQQAGRLGMQRPRRRARGLEQSGDAEGLVDRRAAPARAAPPGRGPPRAPPSAARRPLCAHRASRAAATTGTRAAPPSCAAAGARAAPPRRRSATARAARRTGALRTRRGPDRARARARGPPSRRRGRKREAARLPAPCTRLGCREPRAPGARRRRRPRRPSRTRPSSPTASGCPTRSQGPARARPSSRPPPPCAARSRRAPRRAGREARTAAHRRTPQAGTPRAPRGNARPRRAASRAGRGCPSGGARAPGPGR